MTREDIINFCKFAMNVNSSQANDDISDANWITLVQNAYKTMWNRIALELAPKGAVVQQFDTTWPSGDFTFTLPTSLENAIIYECWYLDSNGQPYSRMDAAFDIRNVMRLNYYPSFSPGGFPFRIYYIPDAEKLAVDNQVPALLPARHHEVIAWEALRTVKMLTDKEIPESWQAKFEDLELSLMKEFQSRPLANRPNVRSLWSPIARPLI
jgi:hypothetical protein